MEDSGDRTPPGDRMPPGERMPPRPPTPQYIHDVAGPSGTQNPHPRGNLVTSYPDPDAGPSQPGELNRRVGVAGPSSDYRLNTGVYMDEEKFGVNGLPRLGLTILLGKPDDQRLILNNFLFFDFRTKTRSGYVGR